MKGTITAVSQIRPYSDVTANAGSTRRAQSGQGGVHGRCRQLDTRSLCRTGAS